MKTHRPSNALAYLNKSLEAAVIAEGFAKNSSKVLKLSLVIIQERLRLSNPRRLEDSEIYLGHERITHEKPGYRSFGLYIKRPYDWNNGAGL